MRNRFEMPRMGLMIMIGRSQLQHGRDLRVNLDLARLFREMLQRPGHGFAGNPHDACKWIVEFEDDKHGARDRERPGEQGQSACSVRWRENRKAQENYHKPY